MSSIFYRVSDDCKTKLDAYRLSKGYTWAELSLTALIEFVDDSGLREVLDKEIKESPKVGWQKGRPRSK